MSQKASADPSNAAYSYNYVTPAGYLPINVSWWLGPSASGAAPTTSGFFVTDGGRDWTVKARRGPRATGMGPGSTAQCCARQTPYLAS